MPPFPEVHLGDGTRPAELVRVDQHRHLDGVTARELELGEKRGPHCRLTRKGLVDLGELREEQAERRFSHKLGHPPTACRLATDRPSVAALHEVDALVAQERAEEIARMISGATVTETSLRHAEQMLKSSAG